MLTNLMLNGESILKIDLLSKAQLSIINKNSMKYPLATAEKDYILAIILHIIYNTSLKDKLIFKGGTAIHHIYLDQLRFSEDLDFSSAASIGIQDIKEAFNPYSFLEVISYHESQFALKIDRMKYHGPLEQPNSIKIDIDLTQELLLPPVRMNYNNYYKVPVSVQAMNVMEICAEKLRAINERARYRDFYDLTFVVRNHDIKPGDIISILLNKELRKPLSKNAVMENLKLALMSMQSGSETIYYRKSLSHDDIQDTLSQFICYF